MEILRQHGRAELNALTWETASDVSSSIYSVNFPSADNIPLSIKRSAVDAMNMTARVSEEEQHLLVEMENSVKSLHTSCVKRREIMCKLQITDDSDVNTIEGRKGIYSLQSKALHEDQVNLCVACNLFKDFIVLPSEIVNYMEQHIDVKHNYIIEIESDDDDAEIDDESELLG